VNADQNQSNQSLRSENYAALLWSDHDYRRRFAIANRDEFNRLISERFPLAPRSYVDSYIEHMIAEHHIENPLCELYLESELGAIGKYGELIRGFAEHGFDVKGKSCLDIGCSNGALALACLNEGASNSMGVDISQGRIDSAAMLCADSNVRLACVDIVADPLVEKFDAIFCTDVLEHVENAEAIISEIAHSLRRDVQAFAYITVFNRNAMQNVLNEPHFSIPGLIRLNRSDGKRIWHSVRSALHSQIDYDVFDWYDYSQYAAMAEEHALVVEPCYSADTLQNSRALDIETYEEAAANFEAEFKKGLAALPLLHEHAELLKAAAVDYLRHFRTDHEKHSPSDHESAHRLFMKYYAQPIAFMMHRRDGPPPPATEPRTPKRPSRLRQWIDRRSRGSRS
jgi:2-polyprenyl-3-methyl-5-hydroxy-6-metoxy-1,4-benzoquinol methylase